VLRLGGLTDDLRSHAPLRGAELWAGTEARKAKKFAQGVNSGDFVEKIMEGEVYIRKRRSEMLADEGKRGKPRCGLFG
jgi:hypothetical protein